MALLHLNGLFDTIEMRVGSPSTCNSSSFRLVVGEETRDLTCTTARAIVHGPERDGPVAHAVWRTAVLRARADGTSGPAPQEPWNLLPVWLALPRLRSAVHRITLRLPAHRGDLEAEAVLGVLEGVHEVDPEESHAGERLMRAASGRAWQFATRAAHERPVSDVAALADERAAAASRQAPGCTDGAWELQISPPDRADGLAAPLYFTASREQIAGERLGALAAGIGLRDVVYRARRPRAGRRIGALSLRPAGSPR